MIYEPFFVYHSERNSYSFCLLFVFFSLQSLGCRRVESVTAGGQHCHWSVSDCARNTKYLHYGVQGNYYYLLTYFVMEPFNFKYNMYLYYCSLHRHSCALTTATVHSWRRCLKSTCVSCRSISQKQPSSRSSLHCAPSSSRCEGLLMPCLTVLLLCLLKINLGFIIH